MRKRREDSGFVGKVARCREVVGGGVCGGIDVVSAPGSCYAGSTEVRCRARGWRAAHGVLNRLGKPGHARAITASATARRRQRVVDRFSEFCASPGDFCGLADADTIICRCEEVSLKDLWQAVSLGDSQPEAVKRRTRCGMGMCQGRICGPTLARFVSSETGVPLGNLYGSTELGLVSTHRPGSRNPWTLGRFMPSDPSIGRPIEGWVSDDGPGIPPDALERVFERFYRVDRARSRDQGGTGLGLSIVKHIVQSHGGEVRAESTLGSGATFFYTLPGVPGI